MQSTAGSSGAPSPAGPIVVTQRVPSSARPHTTSGMTSGAAPSRPERQGAEGDGTGAGDAHLVVDRDRGQGVGRVGDRDVRRRRAAPGHAHPATLQEDPVGAGQRQQVEVVVDPSGAGDERRGGQTLIGVSP